MTRRHKTAISAMPADERISAFRAVRRASLSIAAPLSAEDCAAQSMTEASPVKWHLAHTSWFFETFVLGGDNPAYAPLKPEYRRLFNSYYNGVGEQFARAKRGLLTRPDMDEVLDYRTHVDDALEALLRLPSISPARLSVIELGLHHEQQHQELMLTDIKHLLSRNPLHPVYLPRWPLTEVRPAPARWIRHDGGLTEIGASDEGFSFDNERPRHKSFLNPFELSSRLVTNGEFIEFIEDKGYDRPELWLSDGWDKVRQKGWRAPEYWRNEEGQWRCFTLHGDCPIDPYAPVCHLSYFEADAYARWTGARLPTEAEWEFAATRAPAEGNFVESGAFHPLALRERGEFERPAQMFGDVWEWTQSPYSAYPGYAPAEGAIGEYNGKFMNGQYVLRGGSCVTPSSHIRKSYRNFFPPDARWQFSGLRLARDAARASGRRPTSGKGSVVVLNSSGMTGGGDSVREELISGLTAAQARISPKFFYNLLGSHLFEAITQTDEYYLTRTEKEIFVAHGEAFAECARMALGEDFRMVDIGAGNCEKAASLFPALRPAEYAPVEISGDFLRGSVAALAQRFQHLPITAIVADFSARFALPGSLEDRPTLFFYPGSSLGNFSPAGAKRLLSEIAASARRSALLIGVDLVKETAVLEAAYNDRLGVTAAFNLNALDHANAVLGSDFDVRQWRHEAIYDAAEMRVEMRLAAKENLTVRWPDGERRFGRDEHIISEFSYKWRLDGFERLLRESGFQLRKTWTDERGYFAVAFATRDEGGPGDPPDQNSD